MRLYVFMLFVCFFSDKCVCVCVYSFTSLSGSDCHGSGSVFRKFVCVCQRLQ